jgi:hypothetical protein
VSTVPPIAVNGAVPAGSAPGGLREALLARVRPGGWAGADAGLDGQFAALAAAGADGVPTEAELAGLAPDLDAGPPDGEFAWLADLPGPLLDEYLAATTEPAVPEALAAGFWDRSTGEGRGFAAGGVTDELAPGLVLAGLAADVVAGGLGRLADDELIGVLRAGRRLASWSASVELAAAGDLMRRRMVQEAAGAGGAAEHADAEIAAALTLTGRAAGRLLDLAMALERLPLTSRALAAGSIDLPRAMVIVDETAGLGAEHAAAVEERVLARAAGQTTTQVRAATSRAVSAVDPGAVRKRQEKAAREARVERWAEHAGTAALAGRDLPPVGALAADQHVSELAAALRTAGVAGTMDQLRAQVFVALLTGQPVSSLLPPGTVSAGGPAGPSGPASAGRSPGTPGSSGASGTPGPGAPAGGRPGPGTSGFSGASGAPGPGAPGGGMSGPGACGFCGASGTPGPGAPAGGTPSPGISGFSGAPGSAGGVGWPGGLAVAEVVNLTVPLSTWLGLSQSPGEVAGFGPLAAGDCRRLGEAMAPHPQTRWYVTIVDKEGRPVAHGCLRRRRGQRGSPGGGPGPPSQGTGLVMDVRLEWLEAGECAHRREVSGYRPSVALEHLIRVRQAVCAFPGCQRAARRCDQDHTIPYDQGGRTCECNLAPLCRRHHQAKQAPGWHLDQPEPGTMIWTTPSGRSYTTHPTVYPS